jgi:8-oxo-dGTP diphosphatase
MSVTDRSRRTVEETLTALEGEHGSFPVLERDRRLPRESYRQAVNRFERHDVVGGAGAWVTAPEGRVLFVREAGGDAWVDPGATQHPGESLAGTARRAVREAAGLEATVDGVLRADRFRSATENEDWPPVETVAVTFAASADGSPAPPEGTEARWFADYPERVGYEALLEFPFPARE